MSVGEINEHGSFLEEPEVDEQEKRNQILGFELYFKTLTPGTIIPPSDFQNWLHPTFKKNFTKVASNFESIGGWIEITEGPHNPKTSKRKRQCK